MKKIGLFFLLGIVLPLGGCGLTGMTLVPHETATAKVDTATGTISASRAGLTVAVRVEDLEAVPYLLESNIVSFYLTLANASSQPISVPLDAFLVVDDTGRQYRPVGADRMRDIVNENAPYLIPYPYVGYYYLEDRNQAETSRAFGRSLPYFAESHPREILLQALPEVSVIVPGSRVAGSIFFALDPAQVKNLNLRAYLPDSAKDLPTALIFPFSIEK